MALHSRITRCLVLAILMHFSYLQYETQTRQSWERIQQLQRQGMVFQCVAILLSFTDTIQQASRLPSRIRKHILGNTGDLFIQPRKNPPSIYYVKDRDTLWSELSLNGHAPDSSCLQQNCNGGTSSDLLL